MAVKYKVIAAAAVVRVAGTERYLYQGAALPEGVSTEDIARLVKLNLVGAEQPAAPARGRARKSASGPEGAEGTGSDD